MAFEWDEANRLSNLAKHRVDFVDAQAPFDGRPVVTGESEHGGEPRFVTAGVLEGRYGTVVWTWRGGNVRLIPSRRARDGKTRAHRSVHGG